MNDIERIYYKMLLDYMAPEYADQLSAILANETKQYSKYQFLSGLLLGIISATVILTIWK